MPTTPFQAEAWTEYGLGVLILSLRYFARWKLVGFRNWQGDDYFALLALVFWTVGSLYADFHIPETNKADLGRLNLSCWN